MTDRNPDETTSENERTPTGADVSVGDVSPEQATPDTGNLPHQLGASRYVLAAFFAVGVAGAFLISMVLSAAWNRLADNAWLSRNISLLSRVAQEDRSTYTGLLGAAVGVWLTVWAYRREDIRSWTNDVAAELAKVTWPSKKEVTNSTIVVLVTSAFATVFLALLDRFWSFVTNLVYGT